MQRLEPRKYYHIYNRGIDSQKIFLEKENYEFFLKRFKHYLQNKVDIYAYCLMPNHFHFFIRINEAAEVEEPENKHHLSQIEKAFRNFFMSYAKAINSRYGRTGSLFQYKFRRKEVTNEYYFTWLIFYIHMNPLKASIVNTLKDWRYSSYHAIVSKLPTAVCREKVLQWFGGLAEFENFHEINKNALSEAAKEIQKFI